MPLTYRLADYAAYWGHAGEASYVDVSRRTDPARVPLVWANLWEATDAYVVP